MDQILDFWLLRHWIIPALDIGILSWLIYRTYRILFQSRTMTLLRGIAFIFLIYLASVVLRLETLNWIMNLLAPGLFVGLAILFQPEFRRIFTQLGQGGLFLGSAQGKPGSLEAVMAATEYLSGRRMGALIVFTRRIGLKDTYKQGTSLNADISSSLIISIFFKDTPLHDGAIVINGEKIVAAGVILPISDQPDIKKQFGTRHRAALGLAEETDAVVLVVSEESGAVSLAYDSALYYNLSLKEVRRRLLRLLQNQPVDALEDGLA